MLDPDNADDKIFLVRFLMPAGGCEPTVKLVQGGRITTDAITQRIDQAGRSDGPVSVGSGLVKADNRESPTPGKDRRTRRDSRTTDPSEAACRRSGHSAENSSSKDPQALNLARGYFRR